LEVTLDTPFYGFKLDDEQRDFVNAILSDDIDIVFCNAKSGTGKTTLSVMCANMLVDNKQFENIIYVAAPVQEMKQGYLPGDLTQKSSVYYEPLYQAMIEAGINPNTALYSDSLVNQKNGTAFIKPITHTFTRGTNFKNAVVIIEESQNFTAAELKKILTRCHDSCKVILIGHTGQIDIQKNSGFENYLNHFDGHDRCAVCELTTNHRGWISTYADELYT
jgi:PhoH-like ATPase